MLFSGLPSSALLRLLQATEPGATFDVEVPAGKGIGGVIELRLTSGIPLRVKAMKTWLAELGEDSEDEADEVEGSSVEERPAEAASAEKQPHAASLAPDELSESIWGASIDPSLFGPPATQAFWREPSARLLPAPLEEAQPMDIDDSLKPMITPTAAHDLASAKEPPPAAVSHPPVTPQPDVAPAVEPSLGEATATEDVKPALRDSAPAPASRAPTPARKQENAVAGPSTTSRRPSTVSVAQSATSAARASSPAADAGATRTIPRLSPAPPSTPLGQDDFAPERNSQKPSGGAIKRKADGSPSSGQSAATKHPRLESDRGDGETDEEGESEVASDVDELEDQEEEEARVETLLPDKPDPKGKGRALDAIIAAEAEVPVGPYQTSSLQTFGVGPLADYCARTIQAHFQRDLNSANRMHTDKTAKNLLAFIAGWSAPYGTGFGLFSLEQQRTQLLHQAFLYILRLRHPLINVVNFFKAIQAILAMAMLPRTAAALACNAKEVLRTSLGDMTLKSSRADYEEYVPVLKAIWFWDPPASVPSLLLTHTQRFVQLGRPELADVHLLASLFNYRTLAPYGDAFPAAYAALDEMRRTRSLPPAVESALEARLMHRRRAIEGKASLIKSPSKPATPPELSEVGSSTPTTATANTPSPQKASALEPAPAIAPASASLAPLLPNQPLQLPPPPLPPCAAAEPTRAPPPPPSAPPLPAPAAAPTQPPHPPPSAATRPQPAASYSASRPPATLPLRNSSASSVPPPSSSSSSLMASIGRAAAKQKQPAVPAAISAAHSSSAQHPPRLPPPPSAAPGRPRASVGEGPPVTLPTTSSFLQTPGPLKSPERATETSAPSLAKSTAPTAAPVIVRVTRPTAAEVVSPVLPPAAPASARPPTSSAPASSRRTPVVVELGDSESDEAPAVARVKFSTEYGRILDACEAERLESAAAIAERLRASARALGSTRSCIDYILDRKHPLLRQGANAVNVLIRLTTKDEQHLSSAASQSTASSSVPVDQAKRDKVFRRTCRRDILQGIVSADERKYLDRLPLLRAYVEFPAHHEGTVDRHLKEHFKRIRTRRPRTVAHYEALKWLLEPADFFRNAYGGLVLDALVELRESECNEACLQIVGDLLQRFRP